MYCAPTHPPPPRIILGTLLNDTAFFKERNLAKYLHTEFAHIPDPMDVLNLKVRSLDVLIEINFKNCTTK